MYLDDYMNDEVDYLINEYIYAKTRKGISGSSDIHSDSSVMGDGSNDWPFEYSSPILDAIPRNFAKVVKLLSSLDDLGIYTNDTCGFHHHISFKGMSYKDLIWVYCNLATDPDTADSLSEYDGFNMYDNDYAKWSDLAHLGNALIDRDWKNAAGYLTDSKYRVFRLHPQGTLEWRGPRNFLNEGNKQVIIGFYKLLNHLISNIKNYMDSKYLTGTTITKDEMFKNLDEYLADGTKEKIYDDIVKDKSYEKLIDRLSRNQYLIFKIMKNPEADKFFRKLAKKQTYQLLHKMLQLEANSVEMGYYSKQQIKDSMEYLRDVFADTTTREDTFISYCQ